MTVSTAPTNILIEGNLFTGWTADIANWKGTYGAASQPPATVQKGADQAFTSTAFANVTDLATQYSHSCAVRNDQTVWCWGKNDHQQVAPVAPDVPSPTPARSPRAGSRSARRAN